MWMLHLQKSKVVICLLDHVFTQGLSNVDLLVAGDEKMDGCLAVELCSGEEQREEQ